MLPAQRRPVMPAPQSKKPAQWWAATLPCSSLYHGALGCSYPSTLSAPNLVRHGAVQVLNLTIHCTDRPGLLAEIAQIIADHGHNIKVRAASSCYRSMAA